MTVGVFLIFYGAFVTAEDARDYRDKFDLKFMSKAYGALEENSGEGNTSIDD